MTLSNFDVLDYICTPFHLLPGFLKTTTHSYSTQAASQASWSKMIFNTQHHKRRRQIGLV